jgi:hypothetical protein
MLDLDLSDRFEHGDWRSHKGHPIGWDGTGTGHLDAWRGVWRLSKL